MAIERSLRVVRRFALKCAIFGLGAAPLGGLGLGYAHQLASLLLISAILGQLLGLWHRERVWPAHFTSYDEASWFVLLGSALQRLASP